MKISDLVPWKKYDVNGGSRIPAPFLSLQRELNDVFDAFFSDMERSPLWESAASNFSPRIDVAETEQAISVTAELPGIDPEGVDVTLTQDALTIKGEKKREIEEKDDEHNIYRVERTYGAFTRSIPLPVGMVDEDGVSAEFKHGVLTITLPKKADAPALTKRIEVSAS
jgi:HSP20 family protein